MPFHSWDLLRFNYITLFVYVQAKDPFDVPGNPDAPTVEEITADAASVTWSPPVNDGGAEITHYVLEYKARGDTRWQQVKEKVGFVKVIIT